MVRVMKATFLALCFLALSGVVHADTSALFRQADNVMASGDLSGAAGILASVPSPDRGGEVAPFVRSRMQMARIYHAMGDYGAAMDACREVLVPYPQNVEAANFLRSLERETLPAYILFFKDAALFLPSLLKGAGMTLTLVLVTMVVSPLGGLLIALGRISRVPPLSVLCWFVIWFFRGTPLLLQLFFIYYGLPSLGITLSPMAAALFGLGINYSAYLAEIIRGGIESIDGGQMEAAKAIGMSYGQAMRRVIIPQTYKRLIPPVGNEFIALIKDTALVSTIAMVELMRAADQMFNAYFNINVLILAACMYLLFTTVFTFCFETLERRVGVYEKR
ncbi:ABC transporter permease subunit [Desulfobotulus sp. H1]|uniref:ABC transporter permease subunit n=1 Tax=Desulfobotulus pelophilus TaxID=2823377 RepID=A0ABT3N5X8_9BACT|nr:ABC transporter permease subunit [Desulfobotulus pelophilus]MCW7752860.1 ABC transporter permease subunit [Desulfobotulus pelophilus]